MVNLYDVHIFTQEEMDGVVQALNEELDLRLEDVDWSLVEKLDRAFESGRSPKSE